MASKKPQEHNTAKRQKGEKENIMNIKNEVFQLDVSFNNALSTREKVLESNVITTQRNNLIQIFS